MNDTQDIEAALRLLAQSHNYRVLRRLPVAAFDDAAIDTNTVVGVVVDVETTGLDVEIDEVIELGMVKFLFDRDGRIGRILGTYKSFNEPSGSVPASITQLTGIRDSDVMGHKILSADVESFVEDAALIIAHNAAFDRPFCEGLFPGFGDMAWACSATEIDWRAEGIGGSRLEYIANSFGRFYDAHRAVDDCNAVVNILKFILPRSKILAFSALLQAARRNDVRIFAEGAPYDLRIALKRIGYRWNDGQNGYPRAWWKDVSPEKLDDEIVVLANLGGSALRPKLIRMSAKNRFRRQV